MSRFLSLLGLGADISQTQYILDISKLKKAGCEKEGGKIIFSSNANTCEVVKPDGSKKYLYPTEIKFGEKNEKKGGKSKKNKTKKNKTKKNKTKKNKTTKSKTKKNKTKNKRIVF
jgi:hypothetical protein